MSEPTCRALCYIGAGCLSGVRTNLPGTVLQWCRLFKRCQNLPAGHCVTLVQAVLAVSEPTFRALCYCGADCLRGVRTYLPGTVLQCCRLFKRCQNLHSGHCVTEVQTVLAISESTYRALCYRGAGCLSSVRTYQPGNVLQGCRLYKRCQNLPTGHCVKSGADCVSGVKTSLLSTVLQGCRLFKRCPNLPAGHCVTLVQAV